MLKLSPIASSGPLPRVPSSATRSWDSCDAGHWSQPKEVAYPSRFFSNLSFASDDSWGRRIRSGGLSARVRAAFWVMTAN